MDKMKCLEALRKLDKVVIPESFTYWVHNTAYGIKKSKYERLWDEIPTEDFTVQREMSFVTRDDRVQEALSFGGLHKASNSYGIHNGAKNFQIRVLMPKRNLSAQQIDDLQMSPEELSLLAREYNGLGDYRHPKLQGKEHIFIFASHQTDEISGATIDILYGIREQDIERYTRAAYQALRLPTTDYFQMTSRTKNFRRNFQSNDGDGYEAAGKDYAQAISKAYCLDRAPNLCRYQKRIINGLTGKPDIVLPSEFEKEFLETIKSNPNSTEIEK